MRWNSAAARSSTGVDGRRVCGAYAPATPVSFVNAAVLVAFHEAREAGFAPPQHLVDRAIAATLRQRLPDFSYLYGEYLKWQPARGINRPGGSLGRSQACNAALRLWGDEKVTDQVLIDWLDRLFGYLDRPSATRILPEFQRLAVGDVIPMGRGPSWPVAVVEPNRTLVLDMRNMGGLDWVWQFGLYPVDETRTRLISRSRVRAHAAWARLLTHAIEPAGFLMTRRMLLGLKQRAEALARTGETRASQRPAA